VELARPRTRVKFNGKRKNKKHTKPTETMATYDAQIRLGMPCETFFDGRHFLCAACKTEANAKLQADRLAA